MTHDQRRAAAARIREGGVLRLAKIHVVRTRYIDIIRSMGETLGLSDSDKACLDGHIEDIESDLFADEIKELQTQIETASDLANQSNWDRSREYWEGK